MTSLLIVVNSVYVYWLGDVTDDTYTKTPPPPASVDDSKLKSSIQEWKNIAGEVIPSVHYYISNDEIIHFIYVEEIEKLKAKIVERDIIIVKQGDEKTLTNGIVHVP